MIDFDEEHVLAILNMAEQSLTEAECLEEHDYWLGTINRIYYAAFYAVSAYLETAGLAASKHTGIRALFNKHLVRESIVSPEYGVFYNMVYEMRHESDYNAETNIDAEIIEQYLDKAKSFVADVNKLTLEIVNKKSGK